MTKTTNDEELKFDWQDVVVAVAAVLAAVACAVILTVWPMA